MSFIIYGKPSCPFCEKAKELLHEKVISFEYIDIVEAGIGKAELEEMAGKEVKTVPQVFHATGEHVGGYVELHALLEG